MVRYMMCIAALSMGMAGCSGSPDAEVADTGAPTETAPPVGTTGTMPDAAADTQEPAATRDDSLPDTATPLAAIGGAGAMALAAAAALRASRRR